MKKIAGETLRDRILRLARIYPYRDQTAASFMYSRPADRNKRGARVVVYVICDAADGRATLYELIFNKAAHKDMGVVEWGSWLEVHVPGVLRGTTLAYLNRTFGSVWSVRGVVGWHFLSSRQS